MYTVQCTVNINLPECSSELAGHGVVENRVDSTVDVHTVLKYILFWMKYKKNKKEI